METQTPSEFQAIHVGKDLLVPHQEPKLRQVYLQCANRTHLYINQSSGYFFFFAGGFLGVALEPSPSVCFLRLAVRAISARINLITETAAW